MGDMRTLAVQVPAELFERLDKYLADHKLKKKAFVLSPAKVASARLKSAVKSASLPILYSGIGSCAVAYTLQILGQQRCEATLASLLMCMESVFAVLTEAAFAAWFAFGTKSLTPREISGCAVMFLAIIISQLAQLKKE